ncbi:MAG: peptidase S10 [Proteobacteria bacterium]|nr:peptidase S10 [Pseudomonadota bacterium]
MTHHSLTLPGRTLSFTTTAGAIRPTDERGQPIAEIAYVAYTLDGAERATRPVTFVFNGGPGMASGWLQVGLAGPWIIDVGGADTRPSASAVPRPNPGTWLDFTDLVFVDPAGTGYSRALLTGEAAREKLYSVDGDIAYLAQVIRRWLDQADRTVSPKFILGESYGGFRAPLLARQLQRAQGTGVSGLVLLSPALDFGGRSDALDPLYYAIRLPSMAASALAARQVVTRADLAGAEDYAAGDYVTDLLKGVKDKAAVARASEHVAALTGLDPALVRRYEGRIDMDVFLHERDRAQRRVGSPYDPTITSPDPFPQYAYSDYDEPVVAALLAPVTSGMVALYNEELHWRPDMPYRLSNDSVFHSWDWGRRMYGGAQAMNAMRLSMALDPAIRVLIAQGLFDLVTPYFGNVLILRQMPELGAPGRIRFRTYAGGHMFYIGDAARAAFREDARAAIAGQQ